MKFHVTMAFKKKVIETANPFIAKGAISRAFGLATSNFGLQRWHEEWRDWVDVDTAELQDGDRLNVVFTQEFSNTPVLNHEESAQNINCMQEIVDSLIPEGSSEKHEPSSSTSVKKQTDQLEFKPWPVPFRLPSQLFRPDLKAMLAVKQTLNRKMKSALIQTCYDEMITYTLYPTSTQYKEVALSIITEYPYLRDNIPGCKGYESWSATLSDKFRNERRIMTNVEVVEKRKRKRTAVDAEALTESQMDKNAVNCSIQPFLFPKVRDAVDS